MEIDLDQEVIEQKSLSDHIAVFKRRRKSMLWTFGLVFLLGFLIVLLLPATYRSTAVILIEEQDVPSDLVRSTITSYAVQRIEEIKQRIMTTSNIMSIVERFELYTAKEMKQKTRTEIAYEFRRNVRIAPISAEVVDPRSGRPTETVIAFNLSFDGADPKKVHKVTNEMVTLYLNENLRERSEQSASTLQFLSNEASALDDLLKELELEISKFKELNSGSLPELSTYNMSVIDRGESELIDVKTRLQELEKREIELSSQLIQLNPSAPTVLPNGQTVLSDSDRLRAMQSEYRMKSTLYQDTHPDLIRLKREIAALIEILGGGEEQKEAARELRDMKEMLSSARSRYKAGHPEIIRLENLVSGLEKSMTKIITSDYDIQPDNPTYVLLDTQLKSVRSEKQSLLDKIKGVQSRISTHENYLLKAPSVEKDYHSLIREYDNTRLKYREIKAKQMQADLAKNLEKERKGERFTLVQPPEIPEDPIKPNRIVLSLLVLIFSGGVAIGLVLLREALDSNIYGEKAISNLVGVPVMAKVPYMPTALEIQRKKSGKILIWLVMTIAFIMSIVMFHFFVKPLDVTYYILMRKFGW